MRKRPDQLGRPRGAAAGTPAPRPLSAAGVGWRRWLEDADIVVSPGECTGCHTDDVQSVTSTAPDNPGNFHRKDPRSPEAVPGDRYRPPGCVGGAPCREDNHGQG